MTVGAPGVTAVSVTSWARGYPAACSSEAEATQPSSDSFATAPKIASNISAPFLEVQDRLRKVIIEHLDFEQVIRIYDRPGALFYCDPPYIGTERYYKAGFSQQDHERLADVLHGIKGKFLLSYNDCDLARNLYADCIIQPLTRPNLLSGANRGEFKEILIRNYES